MVAPEVSETGSAVLSVGAAAARLGVAPETLRSWGRRYGLTPSRLDAAGVHEILGDLLVAHGTVATWDDVLRPVLVAAGLRWEQTGAGIDVEHLLSEAVVESLRAHRACQPRPHPGRGILLTSPPGDWHVLPLHVLAAALAELRVPTQVMGQLPATALVSAVRRTGVSGVFVWSQRARGEDEPRPGTPVRWTSWWARSSTRTARDSNGC
ncbi:hypothetical protein GCM10023162_10710 [Klenkia terrae]